MTNNDQDFFEEMQILTAVVLCILTKNHVSCMQNLTSPSQNLQIILKINIEVKI